MSAPGVLTTPLQIYRGDDFLATITLTDNSVPTPNPISLVGATLTSQARNPADAVVITFTVTVTSAAGGVFTMALTGATTSALTPGTYVFDVQSVNAGVTTTYLAGSVVVTADVTRP